MRILGIDPGIGITGWSVVDCERRSTCILAAAGVVATAPNTPVPTRLVALYAQIQKLIATYRPSELAIEKLFFGANVTTAMAVSQARGVVLLAGAQANLPIYEYTPMQVKMTITGYGKASKQQVNGMLHHHVGGAAIPKQDDAADAVAIAVTHITALSLVKA